MEESHYYQRSYMPCCSVLSFSILLLIGHSSSWLQIMGQWSPFVSVAVQWFEFVAQKFQVILFGNCPSVRVVLVRPTVYHSVVFGHFGKDQVTIVSEL